MPVGRLIVFVKAPRLGTVKTRLAAGLGPDGDAKALAVHRRLAEITTAEARKAVGPDVSLVVATTPDDAIDEVLEWLGLDLEVVAQRGRDIGERMREAMKDAFASGASRVVLVGTDAPGLSASLLLEAFAALEHGKIVLGPASDGGYWLLGARDRVPRVFEGIHWSTPTVLRETVALAGPSDVHLLRVLDDIDTAEDLARYPDLLA